MVRNAFDEPGDEVGLTINEYEFRKAHLQSTATYLIPKREAPALRNGVWTEDEEELQTNYISSLL